MIDNHGFYYEDEPSSNLPKKHNESRDLLHKLAKDVRSTAVHDYLQFKPEIILAWDNLVKELSYRNKQLSIKLHKARVQQGALERRLIAQRKELDRLQNGGAK